MNRTLRRLAEPGARVHLFILAAFAAATLFFGMYELAAAECAAVLILIILTFVAKKRREKKLREYIESVTYETENAKSSTLMNFPLPIAVFRLNDARIVWGNEMFFDMCGTPDTRIDVSITDIMPQFSGKWLLEGKTCYPTLLEIGGRKYQLHGNLIRSESEEDSDAFMGITYWVDVTEYDDIRIEYEKTRPVAGIVIIDNLDEMCKNQPDRIKNDIRDAVEDKLHQWCGEFSGILRRYDRDRYLVLLERQHLEKQKENKFSVVEDMHKVISPSGVAASISIGLGVDGANLTETLQFADKAGELALSRGGDQTVIKNRMSFEFYGGRGLEIERRTKVKSRVMANTLIELMKDSSKVIVMGHRYADLDSVGAAVGVCALARLLNVKYSIAIDMNNNASRQLIDMVRKEPEYRDAFVSPQDAMLKADGKTLLVVVDTNRPEQVEDEDLLMSCNRVAVIDHHRVAATYIHNAALGFVEPYASSASELITEILQEVQDAPDILRCEAEALLAGIVLDTKSFTIRTGERTFDAAACLRRLGADTTAVKRMFQTDMQDTVAKYRILQTAELYRKVAVAAPEEPQNRTVAAQAADELLNISGVDASIVVAPDGKGGSFASARSIGELNVQLIMEKLGGGGNRSVAAAQFRNVPLQEALERVYAAIDDYLG